MQIVIFGLFLALFFFLCWLAHRLILATCYPIKERYLGCRSVAGLLLMGLCLNSVLFSAVLKGVSKMVNHPALARFWSTILPQRGFQIVYLVLVLLLLNLGVILLTAALLAVIRMLFREKEGYVDVTDGSLRDRLIHLPWVAVSKFYEETEEGYTLNEKGFTFGIWTKHAKNAFLILWVLQILTASASAIWGSENWNDAFYTIAKFWYYLPLFLFLLIEQVQFTLEGEEIREADSYHTADGEGVWTGRLWDLIRQYFAEFQHSKILLFAGMEKDPDLRTGFQGNNLGLQQREDCLQQDVLEILSSQLRNCGVNQNANYQNALLELLNHRSLNVRDFSRGEFLIYLVTYLNYFFSQGRTALFLCDTREQVEAFAEAFRENMRRLNNIHDIWNVCTLSEIRDDMMLHGVVCTDEELVRRKVLTKEDKFTDNLFFVGIEDGFSFFTQSSVEIERVFNELRASSHPEDLQYLIFSRTDNADLRTAAERYIGEEILPFLNDELSDDAELGIMLWKEEGTYKPQRILGIGDDRASFMGIALPVALPALKYDMSRVFVLQEPDRADLSFEEVMDYSLPDVKRYLGKDLNVQTVIRHREEELTELHDLTVMTVYDTHHNPLEALWRWKKYSGSRGGLIHILSPSYMLRDFFADQFWKYWKKSSNVQSIIPYNMGMKRSHMTTFLVAMANRGMTVRELMEKNREMHWGYIEVDLLLRDCLGVVLRHPEMHNVYEYFRFQRETKFLTEENRFETDVRITLTDQGVRRQLNELLERAVLTGMKDQRIVLPFLRGNVFNYCLPDQFLAVEGHLYQITSIREGVLYGAQRTPETVYQYFQVSSMEFADWEPVDECRDYAEMDFDLGIARTCRQIFGYWACTAGNDFYHKENLMYYDCSPDDLKTEFPGTYVLRLTITDPKWRNQQSVENLLAAMLAELFKTLVPYRYQELFAVTAHAPEPELMDRIRSGEESFEDRVRSTLPYAVNLLTEKDMSSMMPTVYVVEHSSVEYGMVQMLYQNRDRLFSLMKDYLEWHLSGRTSAIGSDVSDTGEDVTDIAGHAVAEETERSTPETAAHTAAEDAEHSSVENTGSSPPTDSPLLSETGAVHAATDGTERTVAEDSESLPPTESPSLPETGAAPWLDRKNPPSFSETISLIRPSDKDYLCFGADSVPSMFDPGGLYDFCQNIVPTYESKTERASTEPVVEKNHCTFCGRPVVFYEKFPDGRCMCSLCKEHQVQQREEITTLYEDCRRTLVEGYHIENQLPTPIHLHFQSRAAIQRRTRSTSGRVLGFYDKKSSQLWVEARGPWVSMRATIFHELTHAWQFHNLNVAQMQKKLPGSKAEQASLMTTILEGFAVCVELDAMRRSNETKYAESYYTYVMGRIDVYGRGLRLIQEYVREKAADGSHMTPFAIMKELEKEILGGKYPLPGLSSVGSGGAGA